ncbi:MAG: hypothetical protein PHY51_00080 [Candidatus Gracilibacteria bacterium]|nr:hypothetical protein [Candidatus Gracilibacteria bacterium]
MKNIKKEIRSGIIIGVSFLGTVLLGGIIYATVTLTASPNESLTAEKWNNLVANTTIPTGFIGAFNSTMCPSGWVEASGSNVPVGVGGNSSLDLRGEFLRGWDNGRGVDSGRLVGTNQEATNHVYIHINSNIYYPSSSNLGALNYDSLTTGPLMRFSGNDGSASVITGATYTSRPRNVSVLFCIKQ